MLRLHVNGAEYQVDVDPEMPLLWVLRDELGLTGTKYGCGIAACGSCTVFVNGQPVPSCAITVGELDGDVTTIEGIGTPEDLHVVQEEWIRHQVAQCGYCQPGQIMTAVSLLSISSSPTDAEIDEAFSQNLCRCGTYDRIRKAVKSASERRKA
jgi:isoquinoline 1-oxidoreductase alpha subunit